MKPERLGPEIILKRLMEIARASALEEITRGIAHKLDQLLGAITMFAQAGNRMLDRREPLVGFFTTKPGGTGLGFASFPAIIEVHDGTIGFENVAAGGNRFWFRLPAAANPPEL